MTEHIERMKVVDRGLYTTNIQMFEDLKENMKIMR